MAERGSNSATVRSPDSGPQIRRAAYNLDGLFVPTLSSLVLNQLTPTHEHRACRLASWGTQRPMATRDLWLERGRVRCLWRAGRRRCWGHRVDGLVSGGEICSGSPVAGVVDTLDPNDRLRVVTLLPQAALRDLEWLLALVIGGAIGARMRGVDEAAARLLPRSSVA